MSLPIMTGTGRLTADPELRFSPSGVAVATMNLAFNARKFDRDRNEWVDGDVFFIRGTLFKQEAENVAESLTKGCEIVVTGRLKTEQWTDRNTGDKRSATSLLIDSIGPSLKYATAKPQKAARASNSAPAADDPWGAANAPQQTEEPPF
ncbi:single-stranded DNA-binding protein [Rhodococcus sp. D2-41]|uniref:single-stranded DNA-binding protein n=1 Tax=Speluncibacter jeojiensis TaxID=2710754 RepID=UPI00240F634B|nr:single-stranded DNA-binding protein [Rhodococcus sp. D2-41]MDG3012169.1 single-stranded DNA-binding protein [Rhodococcus sp. D2-41]